MYLMSGRSQIINCDERLQARRDARTPGDDVIYVDGKPVSRHAHAFEIICNVQPLSGRDLMLVPEGDRYSNSLWVYMQNGDVALDAGNLILREGIWYQVQSSENWGSYTRSRIMEVDVGPQAYQGHDTCSADGSGLA